MRRAMLIAFGAVAASALLTMPFAHADKANLPRGERKFLETVAQHDMAEVQTGKMAATKATNPEAKKFGQQMALDHGRNYEEVVQLARAKSIDLPIQPDSGHQKEAARLAKLSGAQFDRKYMDAMLEDHEKDVKEFQKMARNARDPDVKAFVLKTLPVLEGHLQMARDAVSTVHAGR